MWTLYEILLVIGLLLYLPKAVWRRRLPHRGWSMRLGRYPSQVTERLEGRPTLWVHAVSVGEVLAARPLLHGLTQGSPQTPLVLSTITPSGFDIAATQIQDHGVAIYFPLDLRGCVRRALDALHPRLLLLVESELWPTVIRLAKARGIPIAIVNGRISNRAFGRYQLVKPWLAQILGHVDLFLMQSQADADRMVQLGAPLSRVRVVGSLKWDASSGTRPTPQAIQDIAAQLGLNGQGVMIVAGSTHRGEETAVLKAFHALRSSDPTVRLIIAPRHLERLGEVEGLIRQAGLTAARLSQRPHVGAWDVGLVDTFGQLAHYYALATIAFIGGSLIPHGGQNPLEAASVGKPIVFGPSMENFEVIAHELLAHHAARQVANGQELGQLLHELLGHPTEAQAMGRRAQELTERFQGATERTLQALKPLFS